MIIKFENTEVLGFEHAFRGMRNPMNSWDKSDSFYGCYDLNNKKYESCNECVGCFDYVDNTGCVNAWAELIIGQNDLELAQKLIKAGSEHRKFMRQVFVSVDITAPLYWWKEFDTYKIGTTANSTSTMHKLSTTPITLDCFEIDDYNPIIEYESNDDCAGTIGQFVKRNILDMLEYLRLKYLETKDNCCWKELIRWLPESWLQTRTVTVSYENILNMYRQRKNHKLTEWSVSFINWAKELPYVKELIMCE